LLLGRGFVVYISTRTPSEGGCLNFRAALSFVPLILLALIFTAAREVLASHHLKTPGEFANLESVSQQLFVALWVYLDRQGHLVNISRIEKAEDSSGETNYVVYQK